MSGTHRNEVCAEIGLAFRVASLKNGRICWNSGIFHAIAPSSGSTRNDVRETEYFLDRQLSLRTAARPEELIER
jgi:hypothetical protein